MEHIREERIKFVESLTAIILTKNEERNIKECLQSIRGFVERAIVIDSGSTDKTVEFAKEYGAEVYTNTFVYYAQQFNWGIDNCNITSKWTFRLDADERVTPELREELIDLMRAHENDEVNGIVMSADMYFMGKFLKHGAKMRRQKLMIFKTGIGRIEDRRRDAHTVISSGTSVMCKNKFLHYDFKDLDTFARKQSWYATKEVNDYFDYLDGIMNETGLTDPEILAKRKKKFGVYYKLPMFWRALALFIKSYIFEGSFLNGKEGTIYCFLGTLYYRFLVDAKIYEIKYMKKRREENGAFD